MFSLAKSLPKHTSPLPHTHNWQLHGRLAEKPEAASVSLCEFVATIAQLTAVPWLDPGAKIGGLTGLSTGPPRCLTFALSSTLSQQGAGPAGLGR